MNINKNLTVHDLRVWDEVKEPVTELKAVCRRLAAEGSVLLKNDGVLPLTKGTRVALFGRNQEGYIKSGTGSGGLVNVETVPCIWDSFAASDVFTVDSDLVDIYKAWIAEHPFDNGTGWATEPWSQVEMPVSPALAAEFAVKNEVAVVIIGRTAGEDRDNTDTPGSYRLTRDELSMLQAVTAAFDKTVVVLNVGNLIDLSFMDECPVDAVLYVWQGGQEGANALADVLGGKVSPSGHLPDTQVYAAADFPSLADFGNRQELVYTEDIYVGYRYFETFKPEAVRYPFGYGLTYTQFAVDYAATEKDGTVTVTATVTNTGDFPAKEVMQVYYGAPCGHLGTPVKQLANFAKTKTLAPGESETLTVTFAVTDMASYDDSGITGHRSCYVLEAGDYTVYAGTDVRRAAPVLTYRVADTTVVEQLEPVLPPLAPFTRLVAKEEGGRRVKAYAQTPENTLDLTARIRARRTPEIPYTGDRGIKLLDVAEGRHTMEEFIAQMTDENLFNILLGEGMDSPKVTPGTGAAFGGVTDALLDLGIPVCCVTDGPSGLRLGNDYKATSLPNGYAFASSFDKALTEELFQLEGVELFRYNIDGLLGPGMNIHRHPLCGRNFEYFSEDPVLSGQMAAAQSRGLRKTGCTTTIKHFCANNQESGRYDCNSIVSERALREIYLKGFRIAVQEGDATAIMTSYNRLNGYHTASDYDLTTTVLRREWGYTGMVMTDWWATCNDLGIGGTHENLAAMVRAQNDIFMVGPDAATKSHNLCEGLRDDYIVRSDLQTCAKNLLTYIMQSPTFAKFVDGGCVVHKTVKRDYDALPTVAVLEAPAAGAVFTVTCGGQSAFLFEIASHTDILAQSQIVLTIDGGINLSLSVPGTGEDTITVIRDMNLEEKEHSLTLTFPPAVEIKRLTVK